MKWAPESNAGALTAPLPGIANRRLYGDSSKQQPMPPREKRGRERDLSTREATDGQSMRGREPTGHGPTEADHHHISGDAKTSAAGRRGERGNESAGKADK